jgi:regulator of sigma E protease
MFAYLTDWVLPFLAVLTALVFVHELGHYLVARYFGVRVEVFSIGFGPELFGFNDRHQTRWKVCYVPLGGYVKMFGESESADDVDASALSPEERRVSFHFKPVTQRAWIVAAGPLSNFIFAILIMIGLFASVGVPAPLASVGAVIEGSAASRAGFQAGDTIISIDGEPIVWFEQVRQIVTEHPEQALDFEIVRADQQIRIIATPDRVQSSDPAAGVRPTGMLGIKPDPAKVGYEQVGIVSAIGAAIDRYTALTGQILGSLWQIVTGSRSTDELGGPLRIAQISGQMAQDGFVSLIFFMAALSINLGLVNLLPVPMLDGGHLAFYLAEAVRGRPLDKRIQEYGFRIGLLFVLFLIILATWNDLVQLKLFDMLRGLTS